MYYKLHAYYAPPSGTPPPTPLPDVPSILKQRRPSLPASDPVEGEDPYCHPPLAHLVGEEDGDDEAEDIPVGEHSQWRLWRVRSNGLLTGLITYSVEAKFKPFSLNETSWSH